ncbi:MAG: hypothetical protein DPW16_04290 [Chloroflexi bacterium]|nr:MAG: hypothetical protein F9K46_00615 [Anaerolineae bacterium]MBL1136978.1 hypothetical protein [Chloroflexota bacterium]MBZ0320078.1 hypothetical protein [Anaerolineae bacterium]MCQ3929654.1 hypothetical protein [Chloroflexota bacterium]NOG65085.1 hypothetical protein [Chloroflexota bacterium]
MADIRNTQEIFGDFIGSLLTMGERGVEALIITRAVARSLIRKGILTEQELLDTMREILAQEVAKNQESQFVMEKYKELLESLGRGGATGE